MDKKDVQKTQYLDNKPGPQSFVVHGGKLVVVSGPDQGKELLDSLLSIRKAIREELGVREAGGDDQPEGA